MINDPRKQPGRARLMLATFEAFDADDTTREFANITRDFTAYSRRDPSSGGGQVH